MKKKFINLTDAQFEGLERSTRRALMMQVFLINTPKYQYALGAAGAQWTIVKYPKDGDQCVTIDKWF